jgi:hypothetical protein
LKGEPELMDELERAGNRAAQVIGPFPRGFVSSPHGRLASSPADRCRIERELGQGGLATVYLAERT